MVYTANDLIKDILIEIGAISANEVPSADDVVLIMRRLNMYLGQISATNLMVRANVLESFPLVAGVGTYTIGLAGATVTSDKPYRIRNAFVRDPSSDDTPVAIMDVSEYMALGDKIATAGRPKSLYYDPGATQQANQVGTIILVPPPDSALAYTLFISSEKALTDISLPTDAITFEPPYYEMLMYNMAKRMWSGYHDDGTPCRKDIVSLGNHATAVIETMNAKNVVSKTDLPASIGGSYNIYMDDYNH